MSTFDGWETRLHGDAMALPSSELMHFRTKGSKNGVRRYQTESGEWTPLGLKERKAREGWGDSRRKRRAEKYDRKYRSATDGKEKSLYVLKRNLANGVVSKKEYKTIRKADRAYDRAERRELLKARRDAAREAYIKKRAVNDIKNMSDEELQRRINRVKKELEYKELTKNPILKTGEKLVSAYLEGRNKKLEREMQRAELIVRQQEARKGLIQAKSQLVTAKGNILDNLTRGKGYKQAKAGLINTRANNTIRGAIAKSLNKIITKEGENIAKEMPDHSITLKGARKAKNLIKNAVTTEKDLAKAAYAGAGDAYINARYKQYKKKKKNRTIDSLKG